MNDICDTLRLAIDVLEEARSGYIPGSGSDLEWDKRRDIALERARLELAKHEQS